MLNFLRAKHSRLLVWTLLVLLVIGLAGFGIGNSGALSTTDVASVGDREISANSYARALSQELQTLTTQVGRPVTVAEAKQFGIGNMVLARLVNDTALDEEASRLGLSVGDETVRAQIMTVPGFKGADGTFDRQAYELALRRNGLEPGQFETDLRREAAREMIASSLQSAVPAPVEVGKSLLDYLGERRGFDWLALGPAALPQPVPAPTEAQIAEQYKAHPDRYTRPETRRISYASVTPEELAKTIDVPEADLRAAYDAAGARFNTPEKRLLDRIGFANEADAAAARKRLDAGEVTFDALGQERGLRPADMDQGSVEASALSPEAKAAVFGATGPGIVGPVPTPLGPSLYRINAILAPSSVPFETARAELRTERALKLAKDKIGADTAGIQDMVASGATLEEIDKETILTAGTIDLTAESKGGLADDKAFRDLANKTEVGADLTDLVNLTGGGLVTLRVDAIEPPAVIPLDQVRDKVVADWTQGETSRQLTKLAQGYAAELGPDLDFAALATRLGLVKQTVAPLTRGDQVPGTPPALITDIFAAKPNGTVVASEGDTVILAQLTAIEAFDPTTEKNKAIVANADSQLRTQVADDLLALYTNALRNAAGVKVNQSQIDAVYTRLP